MMEAAFGTGNVKLYMGMHVLLWLQQHMIVMAVIALLVDAIVQTVERSSIRAHLADDRHQSQLSCSLWHLVEGVLKLSAAGSNKYQE